MAGTHESIHIEIDDAALQAALKRLIAQVGRPTLALREVGEEITTRTKRRFATQTDPSGRRWAANSAVTRARKDNPNILTRDGFLGDTIRYQLTADRQGVAGASPG